jgi:tight adherence protein C
MLANLAAVVTFVGLACTLLAGGAMLMRTDSPPSSEEENVRRRLNPPRMFGPLTDTLAAMIPDFASRKVERDLRRAGFHHPTALNEFLAMRNVLFTGVVVATATWMFVLADMPDETQLVVLAVGATAAIVAYALPRVYISWAGEQRAERILRGFPDALDLMVMALTGGMPLQAALQRVVGQIGSVHPDLAVELEIARQQTFADSLTTALLRLAERLDLEEITSFATSVSHAEQMGTSVGSMLREYSDTLRENRLQRAQEIGNRRSIQMIFPVVLLLAPAAFIMLIAPPILAMKNFRDQESRSGGVLAMPDLSKTNRVIAPPGAGSTAPTARPVPTPRPANIGAKR